MDKKKNNKPLLFGQINSFPPKLTRLLSRFYSEIQARGRYSLWWPMRGSSARKETFFRVQVHERVGILLVEVYKRVGKSFISTFKKDLKCLTGEFMALKKSRKLPDLWLIHILKTVHFPAVQRDVKFYARYVKGVPFVNGRYTRGVPFLSTIGPRGGASPYEHFWANPSGFYSDIWVVT